MLAHLKRHSSVFVYKMVETEFHVNLLQGDRAERGALCFPPLRIQPRSVEKVTLLPIQLNIKIQHPVLRQLGSIFFI